MAVGPAQKESLGQSFIPRETVDHPMREGHVYSINLDVRGKRATAEIPPTPWKNQRCTKAGTTIEDHRRIPGFCPGLEGRVQNEPRGEHAIAAGRDLTLAGIGEVLVAWWLGMEVASREFEPSCGKDLRGVASLSMT
ncbi:hypothetical protein RHMOL_Rhmol11G0054400 [Rhododendron molle]|uniref:Uncharacterized protein n=1 Tax=Rhododendron molle TaxID=49168 RepID=A0ACC0LPR2_RHOML|nr:hypothetical protein RHMOL_Rhmol11G0054400 [Rhododendron molle]